MSDSKETVEPPTKKQKIDAPGVDKLGKTNRNAALGHDFSQDIDMSEPAAKRLPVHREKYENYVTAEELEKLHEFQVLDEVKSNDEDSNEEDSDSSDGKSEGLPDDELDKLLDEDLPEDFKGVPKPKEKAFITRQKVVLEEKGVNHFEVLPLDWMMVRHHSGMPVYMHRASRVCTLSKPYFLGKGNTRRHDIPISAIPCLAYRRALKEENKQLEIDKNIEEQIKSGAWQDKSTTGATNHAITNGDIAKSHKKNFVAIFQSSGSEKLKCPFNNQRSVVTETPEGSKENHDITNHVASPKATEVDGASKADDNCEEGALCAAVADKDSELGANKAAIAVTDKEESANDKNDKESSTTESKDSASEVNHVNNDGKESTATESNPSNVNNMKDKDSGGKADASNEEVADDVAIPLNRQPVVLPGGIVMPPPRVETVSTSWKTQHLTHEEVNDYCKTLFKFKSVNIMHFKRWADRRKYTKARKTLQYPTLPEGTKLITIPARPTAGTDNGGKATKRDWVMNMNGRSYLSVFHEYVRRALQKQPVYEFKQLENAATPYQATVYIGGMQYGVGHGSSKRSAKSAAARASIHILIPEMGAELDAAPTAAHSEPDFSFFDYVGIEDPRITEFCAATCEPSPHAILRTCLLRNFGAGDRHIHTEMKKLEYQKIELTMKVGKHTATVTCKNKKTAKQRASQAILQALHPHVRSWGSLLRLYGSRSVKSCKEKKLEEQQITLLQDSARHNEPNYAVLDKLRNEMRKLRERDEAVVPIGTLLMRDDLPTHSGSNLNNVDL